MAMTDWLRMLELFSVACVVIATIYIMQHLLLRAHVLLRIGLVLVCAGSLLEFYSSVQTDTCNYITSATGVVENLGQAAVYIWAATSKGLWNVLTALYRTPPASD